MKFKMLGAAACAAYASIASVNAADENAQQQSALSCAVSAATNFNKAKLALYEQTGTNNFSVEAEIAERRLEEQYCLARAQCETQQYATEQWYRMVLASEFRECLRDEAEEHLKHDAGAAASERQK